VLEERAGEMAEPWKVTVRGCSRSCGLAGPSGPAGGAAEALAAVTRPVTRTGRDASHAWRPMRRRLRGDR
jgi:hypothetical protein